MSILIAIAAIGIILFTLPLLLQLLGIVGVALGYVIGFAILLGIIFGAIYIIGNMTLSDFMSILEIVGAGIGLLIFAGLIANSGIIFSKITEKLGYFFGYLAHLIKIPINKIINKRKKQQEDKLKAQEEIKANQEKKNKLDIDTKINELIKNKDTKSTFKGMHGFEFGGPVNGDGWVFEKVLEYIGKNNISLDDIKIELLNPNLFEKDKNNDNEANLKSLAKNIEKIVETKNIQDEVLNIKNKSIEHIDRINNYKNEFTKIHNFIFENLETILILRAQEGHGLPYTLDFDEHETLKNININLDLVESFQFLKIENKPLNKIKKNIDHHNPSYSDVLQICFLFLSNKSDNIIKFLEKEELEFNLEFYEEKRKLIQINFMKK